MKIKKTIAAVAAISMTLSAMSFNSYAMDYSGGGNADEAIMKPVLTLDIEGKGNQAFYDDLSDIAGKEITVSLNVSGAENAYAASGFHIYFDDRLELVENKWSLDVEAGEAISWKDPATGKWKGISPGEPMIDPRAPKGFSGLFLSTAGDYNGGRDGTMWRIKFKVSQDVKAGDVFPFDIIYLENQNAADLFINTECDKAGVNMQAYLFTKGIFNPQNPNNFAKSENAAKVSALKNIRGDMDAYIAIDDSAPPPIVTVPIEPSWTTTGSTPVTNTSTTVVSSAMKTMIASGIKPSLYGDANTDGKLSISDAVCILQYLANRDKYSLSPEARANADCCDRGDGITANDALAIQKFDAKAIDKLPIYTNK